MSVGSCGGASAQAKSRRMSARALLFAATWLASFWAGCGASESAAEPSLVEAAREEPEPEPSPNVDPEPEPQPEPEPPEPAAVVVEAGARLGAVRLGMTEDEVRALGLEESDIDSRSRRFGPYQVFFQDGVVRRVEAAVRDLGRVQLGERIFPVGTHIFELRDAIGDCEWTEGGGERYRCSGGTLFVATDHTLDPQHYRLAVERR